MLKILKPKGIKLGALKNLKAITELTGLGRPVVLVKAETDLIAAIVCAALNHINAKTKRGTFILDGQKAGEGANLILRFNLPDGPKRKSWEPGPSNFADLAEQSIDFFLDDPAYDEVETGIHTYGPNRALIANTSGGRFLAALYFDFPERDYDYTTFVLEVVADTLARISGDKDLDGEIRKVFQHFEEPRKVRSFVDDLFNNNRLPEIVIWRAWCQKHPRTSKIFT